MEHVKVESLRGQSYGLTEDQLMSIEEVINYHDSTCEILSRDLFEDEIGKKLTKNGPFISWTSTNSEKYIYPHCKKNRWF